MVGVRADTEVETFFAGDFDEVPVEVVSVRTVFSYERAEKEQDVLVCADTGGFEGFGGKLFVLVGDHVDAEGELIDVGTLAAKVEDADFGIGNTTVEAGFGIWL